MNDQENQCLYGWLPKAIQHRLPLSCTWTQAGSTCKGHHFKISLFGQLEVTCLYQAFPGEHLTIHPLMPWFVCLMERHNLHLKNYLEAFLGNLSACGPGIQTQVASHSMFWQELHKNRTKKIMSQGPLQIHRWKHEVDRSYEAWEISATDLRC